jgi:hypothetical protein
MTGARSRFDAGEWVSGGGLPADAPDNMGGGGKIPKPVAR